MQTIWIVDAANGPGTNFTDLPPAVAAASNGDTIIVRPGTYSAFNVSGKALTMRGAGAATTMVSGSTTTISAVPAGTAFYVGGLSFLRRDVRATPRPIRDCASLGARSSSPT